MSVSESKPTTLVDFKRLFDIPDIEFCFYDTYQQATSVPFKTKGLMFCNMLQGVKQISPEQGPAFSFVPHETLVLAPEHAMHIDFPVAAKQAPTRCATVEMEITLVNRVVEQCQHQLLGNRFVDVSLMPSSLQHQTHSQTTQLLWRRIIDAFLQRRRNRELAMRLAITKLIQQQYVQHYRQQLTHFAQQQPDYNGLIAALLFIQQNLDKALNIAKLCEVACMSRSRLFFEFEQYLACSPGEFLQQCRLQSAAKALVGDDRITDISFGLGYQNPSHFSRRFKAMYGRTPRQFRQTYRALQSA